MKYELIKRSNYSIKTMSHPRDLVFLSDIVMLRADEVWKYPIIRYYSINENEWSRKTIFLFLEEEICTYKNDFVSDDGVISCLLNKIAVFRHDDPKFNEREQTIILNTITKISNRETKFSNYLERPHKALLEIKEIHSLCGGNWGIYSVLSSSFSVKILYEPPIVLWNALAISKEKHV